MTVAVHAFTAGLLVAASLTPALAQQTPPPTQPATNAAPESSTPATTPSEATGQPSQEEASAAPAGPRWQWSTSFGGNHYREPSLDMELQGPELGLHLRLDRFANFPRWTLEADVLAGVQRYDSQDSGVMHNSENVETRWRVLYHAWQRADGGGLYLGPAIHTLYNDLRGRASRNAGGYERANVGLWLAAQWRQPLPDAGRLSGLQLDAGRLIQARHTSYLSQANSAYLDVDNTQKHGWYAQGKLSFQTRRLLLEPYLRFTHIKDSDLVLARVSPQREFGYEPASDRWQLGLQVTWPAR